MEDDWLPSMKKRGLLAPETVGTLWKTLSREGAQAGGCAEALWVAVGLELWAKQVLDFPRT